MSAPKVPNQILQHLTCQSCFKWLSVAPIKILTQNGSTICGRCDVHQNKSIPGVLFEQVASHFKFPCVYWREHCEEILPWFEIETHEKNCVYRNKCKTFFIDPSALFKSKRKMDTHEQLVYVNLPDRLLFSLMCSFCQSYLSCRPIFIDHDGHKICHRCYSSKNLNNYVRQKALEDFLEIAVFPCIYKSSGCPEKRKFGRDYDVHEIECAYGQSFKKLPFDKLNHLNTGSTKEKGIIQSHRGYVYGTITPNLLPISTTVMPPFVVEKSSHPIHIDSTIDLVQKEFREKKGMNENEDKINVVRSLFHRSESKKSSTEEKRNENYETDNVRNSTEEDYVSIPRAQLYLNYDDRSDPLSPRSGTMSPWSERHVGEFQRSMSQNATDSDKITNYGLHLELKDSVRIFL